MDLVSEGANQHPRPRLVQARAPKAFQIVLPVGGSLDRHFAFDPGRCKRATESQTLLECMVARTLDGALTAHNGERYVAHVLPLSSGERRRAGIAYAAAAAVFVRKTALQTPSSAEIIARTYKLTPTELRVLLAVVDGGGVPEVAQVLGTAETTVKFHLGNIYAKTGANRQTALVKLVASFSNPLLG